VFGWTVRCAPPAVPPALIRRISADTIAGLRTGRR
jgi:hypothetical protein